MTRPGVETEWGNQAPFAQRHSQPRVGTGLVGAGTHAHDGRAGTMLTICARRARTVVQGDRNARAREHQPLRDEYES